MGVLWKLNFADPVLMLLMAMRAVESVVIPILISDRVAQDLGIANYTHMETTPCVIRNSTDEQLVQSAASQWAMAYWLASSLPGALTAVLIGGWSDRIGRRTPMLLALTGYAIEAMFAMATVHWNLHLAYLIAGSVIEGICGSYPTVLLAVYAHASDSSEPRKRTSRLLLLSLLEFFGVGVFNLVAGELLKYYGVFTTECTVLGGHLIGILYAGFLLADTRGKHGEDPLTEHRPSIQDSSKDSDSITTATGRDVRSYSHSVLKTFRLVLRPWPKRRQLLILLFCFELVVMNFLGISDVTVLYTEHTPLCWPSTRIGYFNAIKYGCLVIAQAIVSPLILRVQPPDRYVAQVALLAVIAYFVVCAFSHTTLQMYLGAACMFFAAPCIATMRSMMSKLVPSSDHGAVFATIASLETIITVLATVIYNNLYSYVIHQDKYPVLPNNGSVCLLLAAGLNFLPVFLMSFVPARSTPSGYEPLAGD